MLQAATLDDMAAAAKTCWIVFLVRDLCSGKFRGMDEEGDSPDKERFFKFIGFFTSFMRAQVLLYAGMALAVPSVRSFGMICSASCALMLMVRKPTYRVTSVSKPSSSGSSFQPRGASLLLPTAKPSP